MKTVTSLLVLILLCGCNLGKSPEAHVRRRSEGFTAKHGLELKYFKNKKVGDKISKIHLGYYSPKVLTMDESRKVLVDVVEGLLRRFNRNPDLKERLATYPMTAQHLDIVIHYDPLFGEYFGRTDTGKMVLTEGKIHFIDFEGKLQNREPYNRARQIARDQLLEQTRLADGSQTKEQKDWLISQVGKEDPLSPIPLAVDEPREAIAEPELSPVAPKSAALSQVVATGHTLKDTVYQSLEEFEQIQEDITLAEDESEQLIASSIDRLITKELEKTQSNEIPSPIEEQIAEQPSTEPDLSFAQERIRNLPVMLNVADLAPVIKPSTAKVQPPVDRDEAKMRLAKKRMRQILNQSNEPVLISPPVPLLDLSQEEEIEEENESFEAMLEVDALHDTGPERGDITFEDEVWPD